MDACGLGFCGLRQARFGRCWTWTTARALVCLVLMVLCGSWSSQASLVVSISPTNVGPIAPGGMGTFEILLTSNQETSLSGYNTTFSFASAPAITAISVDTTTTAPGGYVFPGDTGNILLNNVGGGFFDVNNVFTGNFPNLIVGAVYSLGRVTVSVAPNASGDYALTFDQTTSDFVDDSENSISTSFQGGTIQVNTQTNAVPEPSSIVMALVGVCLVAPAFRRRWNRR